MKKILAVVLALTMIVGMSIPAFAAYDGEDTVINITATYTKEEAQVDKSVIVYDVNVTYDEMVFEYTEDANKLVWDPSKLDFKKETSVTTGSWNKASANITVTNKSNAALTISATATGGFTVTESTTCDSAYVEDGVNGPKTATITVTPPASISETVQGAKVTVSID